MKKDLSKIIAGVLSLLFLLPSFSSCNRTEQPEGNAVRVMPTLEDEYLSVFKEMERKTEEPDNLSDNRI